ncbi:MAG: shikimate kinase [Caulobacteraceae bacterium]
MAAPPVSARKTALNGKTIALVGLMGVGKSTIGRRLAAALAMPFRDADAEVEAAAGRSVADIFETLGEPAFREGERRVIARLLDGAPHVLATGGGAFACEETRRLIRARAISVWLKADLGVLARRIGRRDHRPLVAGKEPLAVLEAQAAARYGAYGEADIVIETGETAHGVAVDAIVRALAARNQAP